MNLWAAMRPKLLKGLPQSQRQANKEQEMNYKLLLYIRVNPGSVQNSRGNNS